MIGLKSDGGDLFGLSHMFERAFQFERAVAIRPREPGAGWLMDRDRRAASGGTLAFRIAKRVFDIVGSLLLVPPALLVAAVLLILNPALNHGPLLYRQKRMGRNCRPIRPLKFRTMLPSRQITRGPNDPVEVDRITRLGQYLRRTRLDELPQIVNVLRGQMSLIGPRPDYFPHAQTYLLTVPEYRDRHCIRPGISGLAQVEIGYVNGSFGTRHKAIRDLYYIENMSFAMEAYIVWRTIRIVVSAAGS